MSKILIIEQDTFFGDIINQKLKSAKHDTFLINNGGAAIDQLRAFKPDLAILDIDMANANAFGILSDKKKDKSIASIPTIIISPSGDLAEIKKVIDLGAKDYLVKAQFNLDDLLVKVNALTSKPVADGEHGGALSGKKIMWIEDDQFLSDLISRKLSKQRCKLLYARTGEEALKILEQESPDMILLDLLLPGINGFDVLEKVRADQRLKDTPVIILSNFSQNGEMERGKKLGVARFLIKATIVLDDLVKEMTAVFQEKKAV